MDQASFIICCSKLQFVPQTYFCAAHGQRVFFALLMAKKKEKEYDKQRIYYLAFKKKNTLPTTALEPWYPQLECLRQVADKGNETPWRIVQEALGARPRNDKHHFYSHPNGHNCVMGALPSMQITVANTI